MNYAVNKEEIVDTIFFGLGRVSTGPFMMDSWAYNKDVKSVPYDVNKAKALLAEADAVAQAYAGREEVLKEVYIWVMSHRGHAALPDSAEKILADFERIVKVVRGET